MCNMGPADKMWIDLWTSSHSRWSFSAKSFWMAFIFCISIYTLALLKIMGRIYVLEILGSCTQWLQLARTQKIQCLSSLWRVQDAYTNDFPFSEKSSKVVKRQPNEVHLRNQTFIRKECFAFKSKIQLSLLKKI